ncbi:gluconokinase [Loktanella sp. IMCC34160]|uniref:gluconokinase n=1 Tax=Loktanella sp. IMCC34160 TaxID=2510646 RepID=UPI0013ECD474|nr:gluconokinase [Loktanella sp. IMCC34160]
MTHVLVMGVCGCGKSSIGRALANDLGLVFVEGDAFHPPENIAHMQSGQPLNDDMRFGWLDAIGDAVVGSGRRCVIACSALKETYRARLRSKIGDMTIIHLTGTPDLLRQRVEQRPSHFMPNSLVASQFADLEPPEGTGVITIGVELTREDVTKQALSFI